MGCRGPFQILAAAAVLLPWAGAPLSLASDQATYSGPAAAGQSGLVLAEESLQVRCDSDGRCELVARYRFENPDRRENRISLEIPAGRSRAELMTNPGCSLERAGPAGLLLRAQGLRACTLSIEADLRADRRVEGEVGPGAFGARIFDFARVADITWDRLQIRMAEVPRSEAARFQLVVEHPEDFRLSGRVCPADRRGCAVWSPGQPAGPLAGFEDQGGPTTDLLTCRGCPPALFDLQLVHEPQPNPWLLDAGPFVGAGVQMQWVEDEAAGQAWLLMQPSARIGFEWAPLDYLNTSLGLESDFRRRLVVVPLVEGGLPLMFQPRLVAFGVGVPVSALPDTRVGVRFQLRLNVLCLSVIHSFDWTPGLPADHPDRLVVTIAAQLSL